MTQKETLSLRAIASSLCPTSPREYSLPRNMRNSAGRRIRIILVPALPAPELPFQISSASASESCCASPHRSEHPSSFSAVHARARSKPYLPAWAMPERPIKHFQIIRGPRHLPVSKNHPTPAGLQYTYLIIRPSKECAMELNDSNSFLGASMTLSRSRRCRTNSFTTTPLT